MQSIPNARSGCDIIFAYGIPIKLSGNFSYTDSFYFEIFIWVGLKVIYCKVKIFHPLSTVS